MITGLSALHARALIAAFSQIDTLLAEMETIARPSESPFARFEDDLSPTQHATLEMHVRYVREQMAAALESLDVPMSRARSSARGPIQTRLTFAEIALADCEPKRLKGYGSVGAAAASTLMGVLAELARELRAMRRAIETPDELDARARIGRLEPTVIDVELLATIERVVGKYGLVELRPLLTALIEQLESGTFEIAFFGRVSSGKSSLINAILGRDVLPVGVTPVTAVPTRVVYGADEHVDVRFALSSAVERHELRDLGAFVSEERNPNNVKNVASVTVFVNASIPRDVALVDTPGVGALATAGARSTYSYLPRCDLGVVVLDASGSFTRDDVRLIETLRDSAIDISAVVGKADLLSTGDQTRVRAYVEAETRRRVGADLHVHFVSSINTTARAWFANDVEPRAVHAKTSATQSATRKLGRLRSTAIAILESSASAGTHASEQIAQDGGRALEVRISRCDDIVSADIAASIVRHATALFARDTSDAPSALREAIETTVGDTRDAVRRELLAARDELRALASSASPSVDNIDLDLLALPNVIVPDLSKLVVARKHRFQQIVLRDYATALTNALSDFRRSTRGWLRDAGERLSDQFAAATSASRVRARQGIDVDVTSVETDLTALGGR